MPVVFDSAFWHDKKVLLTGHTGFKGSWLTFWLSHLGANLKCIALEPETSPNLFDALDLKNICDHKIGNIGNIDFLRLEFSEFQPDIVLHLAAQALVRPSYDDPLLTFQTNVLGTANVMEACRACTDLRSVVIVTTDKCYENQNTGRAFVETDPLGGHDPYSASKACAELVAASYRHSFFAPEKYHEHAVCISTARAGNVIGGG